MARGAILASFVAFTLKNTVQAQGWGGGGGGGWNNDDGPWSNGQDGNNNDDSNGTGSSPSVVGAQILGSITAYNKFNSMVVAHAVLASLVWVLLVPWAALLLRVNLSSPIVLKLHAIFQIASYIVFVIAASLGIWLANQVGSSELWRDVHPRLGLVVLVVAFFQPLWGYFHHRIFKKRASDLKAGRQTRAPGRTVIGRVHLWVGRALIVLGVVNGGLGIRLAGKSPFQPSSTTTKAGIAYGVVAGAMFALYALLVLLFEARRKVASSSTTPAPEHRPLEKLPTYDESESSLSNRPTRYE